MKFLLTMVLALIVSVPALGQRQHGKRVHDKAKVEKRVDKKGCPKCAALKKEVSKSERKRPAKSTKGCASKGKRGSRASKGRSFRASKRRSRRFSGRRVSSRRSSGRRASSRRSYARRGTFTKKARDVKKIMDSRRKSRLDINKDKRKKLGNMIRTGSGDFHKRFQGTKGESRRPDWRKFAEMRK